MLHGCSRIHPLYLFERIRCAIKSIDVIAMLMITLRAVESEDIVPLAETLPKGFQNTIKETWLQRFENWWTLNPVFTSEFPRGWILEEDGKIVGFIGNIPIKFDIHGETKIAAATAAWYVDPSVRGMTSMRLFNAYLNQSNVALFLFKTEKKDLRKVVLKYGFKQYSCLSQPLEYLYIINRLQYIHPVNFGFILLKYFRNEHMNKFNGFSELLKKMGTFTYSYLFQKPLNNIRDLSEGLYTSSLCTCCDDSFTQLWVPHLKSFNVAMSRDKATLNWLYFIAGRRYNRKVIQCRRTSDNSLVGYMVFDFLPWHASGGGAMKLMDMCIMNNNQQILASLISFAIEVGKQNRAPILLLWGDSLDVDIFLRKRLHIKLPAEYLSYIRFSEEVEKNSDTLKIYSCIINPPRGIDH